MNVIDRVVGFFSPVRGLKRARARHAMRVYEGATSGRRGASWRARNTSANAEIHSGLRPLRARAHDLVQNTPHATRMLDILAAHIVGTGIVPVPNTGKDRIDNRVGALWDEWQKQGDVEGIDSFYSMQRLAVRSMIESGEVVMRFIDRERQKSKSAVPLQMQMLESDHIDATRDGPIVQSNEVAPGTVRSRLGVGLGEFDIRTGLWLWPVHPGELGTLSQKITILSKFVPDDELIHLYGRNRPGQVRGVTWFAPILTTARDFADFMDAVTVKARVEACFAAFITQPEDLGDVVEQSATLSEGDNAKLSADNPNAIQTTLEPGMMKLLQPGQDIKFAQPTTTSQVESVMMFDIMAMASGIGLTYDQVSGDLRGANYSSLRAGKIDFRSLVEQIQSLIVIPRLCQRVWDRFIDRAIMAGELQSRPDGYPVEFVRPAWQSINPKFDEDAEGRSVRAGRMTPQQYYASWGGNWKKNIKDIQQFNEACDEAGVEVEIDCRKFTRAGSKQAVPQPGAPGAAGPNGAANGAAKPNGAANGAANGSAASVQLVDSNGDPIDLADLQDMIDAADADGRGIESLPFRLKVSRVAKTGQNGHIAKRAEWNEEDHPRDPEGQFENAGGGDEAGGQGNGGGGSKGAGSGVSKLPGSVPGPAGGGSPQAVEGSGGLKGATLKTTYAPSDAIKSSLEASGATALEFHELGSGGAQVFHDRIAEAKSASPYGAAVALYAPGDYEGMRVFLADDGKVGFALKGDDIVSLFKHPDSTADKVTASVLSLAVDQGGKRLDCFDTALPHLYGASQFKAVARLKWDDQYAPEGWDKTKYTAYNKGEPDVVFMKYDAKAKPYKAGDGDEVETYDEGTAASKRSRRSHRKKKIAVREYNEADHPRDPDGEWTDAGGSEGGGGGDAGSEAEAPLNPEVVSVGGDDWNKETATRLEREYSGAREKMQAIIDSSQGKEGEDVEEESTPAPESWDELGNDVQEQIKDKWMADSHDEVYESEVQNWHDSGGALDDAKAELANGFMHGPGADHDAWALEALKDMRDERDDDASKRIPFTDQQIADALVIDYETGYDGKKDPTIEFNDEKLTAPDNLDTDPSLPGIEPKNPADALTEEMRDDIIATLTKAFNEAADKKESDMEAPEYLHESVNEWLPDAWDNKKDSDKFDEGAKLGLIPEGDNAPGSSGGEITLPATFDPLDKTGSARDYAATQQVARHASIERAVEVFAERNITASKEDIRSADRVLWEGWKGSSTGTEGRILQLAIADELGGRFRENEKNNFTREAITEEANNRFGHIGGLDGVKAYVRAKWETTQYMLEKSGDNVVQLFRGIKLEHEGTKVEDNHYTRLPDINVQRSGAASMTTDKGIANGWGQSSTRVVLRAELPRTAVVSVPAYGQNVHSEHEVVIAGTAWKRWDAWHQQAPGFEQVAMAA